MYSIWKLLWLLLWRHYIPLYLCFHSTFSFIICFCSSLHLWSMEESWLLTNTLLNAFTYSYIVECYRPFIKCLPDADDNLILQLQLFHNPHLTTVAAVHKRLHSLTLRPKNGYPGFSSFSNLYGSDSAKNFLCSRGLALTRSSFTTAWEELQSHSTSARIT